MYWHYLLGAVSPFVSPYAPAAYAGVQYVRWKNDPRLSAGSCNSYMVEGAEYAIGYFGVQYLFQFFS